MSTFSRHAGVAVLAMVSASLFAQSKPDFSGQWKLNKAKSELGQVADKIPDDVVVKIDHKDPELITSQPGAKGASESKIVIDGKENTETAQGPSGEVKSTSVAKWEGSVIAIDVKREMGGNSMAQSDRWTLSEDGKMLTIVRKVSGSMGQFEMKQVLDKQ